MKIKFFFFFNFFNYICDSRRYRRLLRWSRTASGRGSGERKWTTWTKTRKTSNCKSRATTTPTTPGGGRTPAIPAATATLPGATVMTSLWLLEAPAGTNRQKRRTCRRGRRRRRRRGRRSSCSGCSRCCRRADAGGGPAGCSATASKIRRWNGSADSIRPTPTTPLDRPFASAWRRADAMTSPVPKYSPKKLKLRFFWKFRNPESGSGS